MELLGRGDPRVEARSVELFERIVSTGSLVLKTIGGTRSGEVAVQRLLSSPRLSVDTIIEASSMRTVRACAGRRVVCARRIPVRLILRAGQDARALGLAGTARRRGSLSIRLLRLMLKRKRFWGLLGPASGRAGVPRERRARAGRLKTRKARAGLREPIQPRNDSG